MRTNAVIDRLRRANPIPTPRAAGDRELFARITSSTGDPRLARHDRSPRRRRGIVVVIVVGLTAVAASTAFAVSRWNHAPAVKPPVTKLEYLEAHHRLRLPPGATWPELEIQPNSVTGKGAGASHAVMASQHAWECYWVEAIRSDDVAGQQRARAELEQTMRDAHAAGDSLRAIADAASVSHERVRTIVSEKT